MDKSFDNLIDLGLDALSFCAHDAWEGFMHVASNIRLVGCRIATISDHTSSPIAGWYTRRQLVHTVIEIQT